MPNREKPRDPAPDAGIAPDELRLLEDPAHALREGQRRRRQREVVAIPRLRAIGSAALLVAIVTHNALLLETPAWGLVGAYAGLVLAYLALTKLLLVRFYREDARVDLGTLLLATDVVVFVGAIYVSGGERSWLLPLLCVRVADQVATSPRRAFFFATETLLLHAALVLYMAFVEQRGLSLSGELTKVALVYLLNVYLALAAGPAERQRRRARRLSEVARSLIAQLRQRTAQLEVQRARAEAANQAKSAFLSNMSHEIRTPMTAVLGNAELLLAEPLRREERAMAQTILTSGKSLLALVNDVLDMSKVEAGRLELHLTDVDLGQLLESVLSPIKVLAKGRGLALQLHAPELPERPLRADALRLRQVLSNLVGNAIKFTERGRVTLRVTAMQTAADAVRVAFAVEDTGVGMTEEQITRVFEPFQQADGSTTRRFGGTGLGLSICRSLVTQMGGDIDVRSAPGHGSVFSFSLDFELGKPRPASQRQLQAVNVAALLRQRGARVLVAEDTEVNRELLTRLLQHLGCKADSVSDGAQAVERLARDHGYDLALMDWHMPVMDGVDAVIRIRRWEQRNARARTPIVGVTASAFAEEVEQCLRAGMDEVLSKPLSTSQLERVLCERLLLAEPPAPPAPAHTLATSREDSHLDRGVIEELARLDADPARFMREIFADFLDLMHDHLPVLRDSAAARDWERLRATAHRLKGAAGSVGAQRLAEQLEVLETQARRGEAPPLEHALARLAVELGETERAISATLEARKSVL